MKVFITENQNLSPCSRKLSTDPYCFQISSRLTVELYSRARSIIVGTLLL